MLILLEICMTVCCRPDSRCLFSFQINQAQLMLILKMACKVLSGFDLHFALGVSTGCLCKIHLLATGLLPSDNGGIVPALSVPPKPAPPVLAEPDDDRVTVSSKPPAHAKPDPSQKVCLTCLPASQNWHAPLQAPGQYTDSHVLILALQHFVTFGSSSNAISAMQLWHC